MFEKKSDEKTFPCVNCGPFCVFIFEIFIFFPYLLTYLVIFHLQQLHYIQLTLKCETKTMLRNSFSKPFAFSYKLANL
jgi:hypothetical protein